MKLTWTIKKKRGNWRPVLQYHCSREPWEMDLNIPGGETSVMVVAADPAVWSEACLPGQGERAEGAQPCTRPLRLPKSYETDEPWSYDVRLPWRPGARPEYPEVEQAMRALMAEWERQVQEALASGALNVSGEIESSPVWQSKHD